MTLLIALMLILALPVFGQGYVDPGAGAMIWQIVMAAFVGGMFLFRKVLTRWFRRSKSRDAE